MDLTIKDKGKHEEVVEGPGKRKRGKLNKNKVTTMPKNTEEDPKVTEN